MARFGLCVALGGYMRHLALVGVLLGLALSSTWAQTTPLTWQELDALGWPTVSMSSVEGRILQNVRQIERLNEEMKRDVPSAAGGAGAGKIIGHFFPPIEVPLWCNDAREAAHIAQMQSDINNLRDNIIKLEHVLFKKDPAASSKDPDVRKQSTYWKFYRSPDMAKYHGLKLVKPLKQACQPPSQPPVAARPSPNDCMALAPSNGLNMFPPDWAAQQAEKQIIQQRTPAFQACMRRANGLPPLNADGSPQGYTPSPPRRPSGAICGVTVRC